MAFIATLCLAVTGSLPSICIRSRSWRVRWTARMAGWPWNGSGTTPPPSSAMLSTGATMAPSGSNSILAHTHSPKTRSWGAFYRVSTSDRRRPSSPYGLCLKSFPLLFEAVQNGVGWVFYRFCCLTCSICSWRIDSSGRESGWSFVIIALKCCAISSESGVFARMSLRWQL